jgi:hypothetical protein
MGSAHLPIILVGLEEQNREQQSETGLALGWITGS